MEEQFKDKFTIIRYANCWEDANVLVKGLSVQSDSRVVSIASAGDNSFSLLCEGPEQLIAVDINPVQLYLTELKKCAMMALEYEEFLAFIGVHASESRLRTFDLIKSQLSSECRAYFEANLPLIQNGLIHSGKFEGYFRLFRKGVMPLVHSRKTIDRLFQNKNDTEQETFYTDRWNNLRWKILFRLFFSRTVMGKRGRDPAFFKEVTRNVSEEIYQRAAGYLVKKEVQDNPYLHYMFYGNYGRALPHYLIKENFDRIKQNLGALVLYKGWAEDAAQNYGNITHFNLSNIFEYMSPEQATQCAVNLHKGAAKDARFQYWNLLVNRQLQELLPQQFALENTLSEELTKMDGCFFYERCLVNTAL